jgi:DMSO/TMAO reductase YedYZ heme-binding membrane subunit
MESSPTPAQMAAAPSIPAQKKRDTHWLEALSFSVLAIAFGFFQYAMQASIYSVGQADIWIRIRTASFAGATFIGFALLSSVIFRLLPRTAQYWRVRRYLGVWGVIYIYIHIICVYIYYDFVLADIYPTWNPFDNPKVWGLVATPIFLAMAVTSSDRAMDYITPKRWKFLHRFVYVAYLASVFHYISVNPDALLSIPGALLLLVTALTIVGHTYLFFRIAIRKRFRSVGSIVGLIIIASAIIIGWMVYQDSVGPFLKSLQ